MERLQGGCHCGNVRFEAHLTLPPESYRPRACDCDFCRKHAAAYVSDPAGSLTLLIRDTSGLTRYRQGNGLAEMLICGRCGTLLGALYQGGEGVRGVINARAVDPPSRFGALQPVSPRTLSAAEKTHRWQQLWFPNVSVRS
jgi:hypothetical protein